MTNNKHCGEIIESSLTGWVVQSWHWKTFPSFGSLVTAQSNKRTIFGLVHQIQMGSMDPSRYPFPYQKTEEELLREQPQIFEFLKTTFSCITLGYEEGGVIFYLTAPEPPKIHTFVGDALKEQQQQFFCYEHYLHSIFSQTTLVGAVDELLLAVLKHQASMNMLSQERLVRFIETFSLLTGNDYRRLKLFLQRAQHIVNHLAR